MTLEEEKLEEKQEAVQPEQEEPKPESEEAIGQPEEKVEEESVQEVEEQPVADTPAAEEGVATATDPEQQPEADEQIEQAPQAQAEQEKMIPQSQVNKLIGEARAEGRRKGYEQARAEARERYGVEDDDEMDSLFADGSRYGELNARYADGESRLKDVQTELALVKSQILPERQGDVKAILSANGLEVTEDNIASMLPTHPEWKASQPTSSPVAPAPVQPKQEQAPQPAPSIKKLGVEPNPSNAEGDEDAEWQKAKKMFGFKD